MNALAWRVLAAVLALCAAGGAVLYVRALRADLAAAELTAQTAQDGNRERDRAIAALRDHARENDLARARLEQERSGIRNTLNQREIEFRRLVHENAELRAWADGALPGVVIGMHDHTTITGAEGYRAHMRTRNPLRAAGGINPH